MAARWQEKGKKVEGKKVDTHFSNRFWWVSIFSKVLKWFSQVLRRRANGYIRG